jgi:D-glycero-D-manno-heptose 1,7-bisphosphate phosphatase
MGIGSEVTTLRRAVFLDRDGVLNRAQVRQGRPHPPANMDELKVLPGVPQALWALREAGWLLIVVTNQPDVARGITTREDVEAIHAALAGQMPIDEFRTCFHDDAQRCTCRKPEPGLLLDAAREHSIDLAASYMVGDRWRDVQAGERAGCTTLFIDYRYAEPRPERADFTVTGLPEAARIILGAHR